MLQWFVWCRFVILSWWFRLQCDSSTVQATFYHKTTTPCCFTMCMVKQHGETTWHMSHISCCLYIDDQAWCLHVHILDVFFIETSWDVALLSSWWSFLDALIGCIIIMFVCVCAHAWICCIDKQLSDPPFSDKKKFFRELSMLWYHVTTGGSSGGGGCGGCNPPYFSKK